MPRSEFVHLHLHTQYSLLDGACRIPDILAVANQYGMDSLAITDHGGMFGAVEFYIAAQKSGIKPIIGCEVYVAPKSRLEKTLQQSADASYHLILLAKDETGYQNLMKLASIGYLEGFYYKPRIDKECLSQLKDGLIGFSACLKGEIPVLLQQNRFNDALKIADEYASIFGRDNFYLELQENTIPQQKVVNEGLIKISQELKLPLIATNDVHYLKKEHSASHEALLCIQTQTFLSDPNRMRLQAEEFYFKSPQEMKKLFEYCPQAIANTVEVASRCNVELDFSKVHLPKYEPPVGRTKEEYLRQLCEDGLKERFPEADKAILDRLEYELKMIKDMGFVSYFLIVWDFINFAKKNNIPVGPGRGSAAGSLVSYLLGITDINPLKYGLLFERFLNPERIGLPDIDIDFCYERRQEVINYVTKKYGQENVAQIITFGTMQARAVVRDVGRVMGIAYADVDRIAKLIPAELDMTLKKALETEAELNNLYKNDPEITKLINTALSLEGLNRHASMHAAGVVIADKPLSNYMPLFKTQDDQITTGYSMSNLEKIGLLKVDFLGLRTLTVIDQAVKIIKQTRGQTIDIARIPLDDKNTYKLFANAQTIGVFQVESSGMRDLLRKLVPERFEDVIALLALYRPGPIGSGMLDDFIKRKHNLVPVKFDHKKLEPILKETYGIIVYQEQIMQIASSLAGFSLAQADLLRRAMSKKIPQVMEKERKNFLSGCIKNSISENVAAKIFDLIEYFSGYGFNKCVVGSTQVIDADSGKSITVSELFHNKDAAKSTFSCDENLKITKAKIKDVIFNGIKPVYSLKTVSGKEITCTFNHPFLTRNGWKNLQDLRIAEDIAVPRKISLNSDIIWDPVVSVDYVDRQETFDLEIEGTHNFIADGIIVHNSHSAAYAMISYRTAYLKANYPVEFMCALLTSERDNTDKIVEYVNEAGRMGIKILPPDINESQALFNVVDPQAIRFGLLAIKNVGRGAIESIIEVRDSQEKFKNLEDLCRKVDLRLANKKVLESLAKCGALDDFKMPRAQMVAGMDKILDWASKTQKEKNKGQLSFFDQGADSQNGFKETFTGLPQIKEWPEPQILAFEKEMLGFYVSGHPLARYANQLIRFTSTHTANLKQHRDEEEIKIVGLISKIKHTLTRAKQEKMAIMLLEDLEGSVETLVFPRAFGKISRYLQVGTIVMVRGTLNLKEETPKIIVNDLFPMDEAYKLVTALNINLSGIRENLFESLKELLAASRGAVPIYLHLDTQSKSRVQLVVGEGFYVTPSEKLIQDIESLIGPEKLSLVI